MSLPVHRWFRYSAGFSAEWAESVIKRHALRGTYVFDPFAGSGTTLLAAQSVGVPSAGGENHPFVARIAKAKLRRCGNERLMKAGQRILDDAKVRIRSAPTSTNDLLTKCYSPEALLRLEALKEAYLAQQSGEADDDELLWLSITSILRECSGAGTAQWQYVLPSKTKARVRDPFYAFASRIEMFCADMRYTETRAGRAQSDLRIADSRAAESFADLEGRVGLILTSPPYPNNYDYADATRLEMTFWDEIRGWGELQKVVRHRLVRSCSQHAAAERLALPALLSDPLVAPIAPELAEVCAELETVRETKGGRKTYHTMIAAYFIDLAATWHALRPLCAPGAQVCCVIGDSAPYGVHVPVENWLARLALSAGFSGSRYEKIRDRNLKWKNRKHRVPLQEGNLWLEC